jgi:hypothetical protein
MKRVIAILRNVLGLGLAALPIGLLALWVGWVIMGLDSQPSSSGTDTSAKSVQWPQPRFFVGQTIRLKPAGEPALVVKSSCWPWLGCQYRLRLVGQTESWFKDSDPALP